MATEFEKASEEKRKAVRSLVNGFSSVPSEWARHAAANIDKDDCVAMPMWGTVFIVNDSCDERAIRKLMRDAVPTEADDLIAFAEEHGIEIDEPEMKLLALAASEDLGSDSVSDEIENIRREINDKWYDSGNEEAMLASCGWQDVAGTGILAREIDGNLVLGINGAGYDFYESHWMPLYDALGYTWHERHEEPVCATRRKRSKKKVAK